MHIGCMCMPAISVAADLPLFAACAASVCQKTLQNSPFYQQCKLKLLLCVHAVIWFVYMLIYGVFPQNLSQGIFHLFQEIMATSATFWLLILMAPVACVLPGYLWRQFRT